MLDFSVLLIANYMALVAFSELMARLKIMMVRNKIPIVGIFPTMGITLMPYLLPCVTT